MAKVHKMKRLESRKSHSWWWDSHISPKNSKWLAENLEDMDQSIKRMLKLIEEDGDTFAKKADMYYQKRPELVANVEEFYRMYRSLAERYDNLTGELRKNIDLQSQGSVVSDSGSELASPLHTPERKPSRRSSSDRAPGFDFFLGSGGASSDLSRKESDSPSSSSPSSESDSDGELSKNNSSTRPVNGDGLHRRITELETEVLDVKEKLRVAEEENSDALSRVSGNGNYEELLGRVSWYDEELKVANQRLTLSEESILTLKAELESLKSRDLESVNKIEALEEELRVAKSKLEVVSDQEDRIKVLEEELRISNDKVRLSEDEIARLKLELEKTEIRHLESSQKELQMKESERKRALDLEEQIKRRDNEIGELKGTISKAEKNLTLEKSKLLEKISTILKSQAQLEEKVKKWELKAGSLEEEMKRVKAEEATMESEIKQLKADIGERNIHMEAINKSFDALKHKYDMLMTERDELLAQVSSKDDHIREKDEHLHRLHVELVTSYEMARKLVEETKTRVKTLEDEVERQRSVILDAAEGKREAIRQLCFSLEHYRNGYQELRQAFLVHKRPAVLAS